MTVLHRVTVEPLGREVQCRDDQTILDACLRAGVWLPHSCTHGTCATCKADLIEGEVEHGRASTFALMDFERDEGKLLPCCATPTSDVVIEADLDADDGFVGHPVEDYAATVVSVNDVALETRRVELALDRDLVFNAGQYVRLAVPGTAADRTYSLANPPSSSRALELQVRRVPGGLATDGWVFGSLAAGDEVRLSGPYGRFCLRTDRAEPIVMVAGGTGLAPLTSMIRHALETDAPVGHITLYQGARTRDWLYDVDLLSQLEKGFPDRFSYRPCLSEETVDGYGTGLVTDVLDADLPTLHGHVGYVCGPPAMVEAALRTLMSKRLFPRDIYREDFFDESDRANGTIRSPLIRR